MSAHTTTLATFGGDVATQSSPSGVITSMLKEYLPYELLFEELMKRDYLLSKVDKDQSWKGGELSVPFMGGKASSFAYGELTAIDDITEDRPVRGKVSEYAEIWGSMIFHQKDLDVHTDMAQSFLKILPDRLEDFIERMKEAVSVNILNGQHFDSIKGVANAAAGRIQVYRPSRFQIGQYVTIGSLDESTNSADLDFQGYIRAIDMDAEEIELVESGPDLNAAGDALGTAGQLKKDIFDDDGATGGPVRVQPINLTGVAVTDKIFLRGVQGPAGTTASAAGATNTVRRGFTSLRSQLLSAANGGSANLFGVDKLQYPHLQAVQQSGVGMLTALLEGIFDTLLKCKQIGKGNPTDAIMSYSNLAVVMKELEQGLSYQVDAPATEIRKGAYGKQFTATDTKVNAYGWTEISVSGFGGSLKLVGVHEMDDDVIYLMDWRSLKLHSNGFFERRQAPDGKEYFEDRATTGYRYVIDTRFYGELVLSKPSHCGVIHNLS